MEEYTKLYKRVVDSSVWKLPSDYRIVWITLLALKDSNGLVMGTEGWLAMVANVPLGVCRKALAIFKSPDDKSRTPTLDGRKIVEIDGGWQVVNHFLYRDGIEDLREKWRRQKREQKQRKLAKSVVGEGERKYCNEAVEHGIPEADRRFDERQV